ncbi:MAG: RagB/SusD family nutrient uptake outer membrane protein [Dysgonamonadaceae bacterium]|nr:RagB/SusD family nutrient uptake outer membrane protein [Dysgonamonadaceae bacterium]
MSDCNKAIEIIQGDDAPGKFGTDPEYTNLRLSELYFNRAWFYYLMTTLLGDVPLQLKSTSVLPKTFYYPKATSEEIYARIIADIRFAYEHLPETADRGRYTKWAAAHFLAKLYLQRAQGQNFGQYRNADGSINPDDPNASLGLLYKGAGINDLDSAQLFATEVIDHFSSKNGGVFGGLAVDYWDLFRIGKGDWSNEDNSEIILPASYISSSSMEDNGRYGMRTDAAFTIQYYDAAWNIPARTWAYGVSKGELYLPSDWGYDVFTDKINDSRFEKSFQIEYPSASFDNASQTDGEGLPYNNSQNKSLTWTAGEATYFNANIRAGYDRASWDGRAAAVGEHKIGKGDLGLVFLENTKETAIDKEIALAQPYVLYPRWIRDGSNYYYRKTGKDRLVGNLGLLQTFGATNFRPSSRKFIDPNRTTVDNHFGSRDVAIFRLAETYLIRAEAYGRQGNYTAAINDINVLRKRAAYKNGEQRAEVLARLYPGSETLLTAERSYPYRSAEDTYNKIKVDAAYWDGVSEKSRLENYPPEANTDEKRFIHFIYNEVSREFSTEQVLYDGIHHAGIQLERVLHHNQLASSKQGNWPVSDNPVNGNGQDGNGKGVFRSIHTFKPFPQTFIDLLTDENNVPLSPEARKKYQNPGY